jgi:hypothetical protein
MYIAALAAPNTVNTMPDETLHASPTGSVGSLLSADGGDRQGARRIRERRHRCRSGRAPVAGGRSQGLAVVAGSFASIDAKSSAEETRPW